MQAPITITDVRLAAMAAERMTPAMAQSGVGWYELTLSVRNTADEPVYLMVDIRRIRYDGARRVLQVQLSEHEPLAALPGSRPPLPPQYRAIGAGATATIVHPLSSPITFLESPGPIPTLTIAARARNLIRLAEDVDAIECTVAYETAPPPPVRNLAAREVARQVRGRGTTVTGVWTAPARNPPPPAASSQD